MAVIVFGIITLIAGVILSSVPWLNYFILKVNYSNNLLELAFNASISDRIFVFGTERLVFTTGRGRA